MKNIMSFFMIIACFEMIGALGYILDPKTVRAEFSVQATEDLFAGLRERDNKKIIEAVRNRADIRATNNHQYTPLHHAVSDINEDIVRFLIENDALINAVSESGFTPLDIFFFCTRFLSDYYNVGIIEVLLSKEAKTSRHVNKQDLDKLERIKKIIETRRMESMR